MSAAAVWVGTFAATAVFFGVVVQLVDIHYRRQWEKKACLIATHGIYWRDRRDEEAQS